MNRTKRLSGKLGIVLCSALVGFSTCGQPSVEVGVSVPLTSVEVGVEIRAESDFYEPLTPYGRWEVVGSYGRCWIPDRIEAGWRPYSEGYWQRTDAGWYWASEEPWGWATYHYGRWDFNDRFGWYWMPQTQWALAWVSWHSGGGYVGWAPLYPSGVRVIAPRAYVFVEERHFMEPVRRSALVINNTTIINKTVINNRGPAPATIEKASGRKIQAVRVQELRHKEEAAVVSKQRAPAAASEKKVQTPVRSEAGPGEKKTVVTHASSPVEKPAAATHEPAATVPKNHEAQSGKQKTAPAAPEFKPEARPEGNHSPSIKESTGQNANKQSVKPEKPAKPSNKNVQRPAREKPAASDKNGANPADKDHENKPKE